MQLQGARNTNLRKTSKFLDFTVNLLEKHNFGQVILQVTVINTMPQKEGNQT